MRAKKAFNSLFTSRKSMSNIANEHNLSSLIIYDIFPHTSYNFSVTLLYVKPWALLQMSKQINLFRTFLGPMSYRDDNIMWIALQTYMVIISQIAFSFSLKPLNARHELLE